MSGAADLLAPSYDPRAMPGPIEPSGHPVDASTLAELPLFGEIPLEDLQRLAEHFVDLRVAPNQLLMQQGDRATAFFLVKSGALAVYRDAVGHPVQLLGRLHQGDHFGEIALFGTGEATASVRASEESRVLQVEGEAFKGFVERFPHLQLNLQMSAAHRHSENLASVLETGRRREVRIRCRQPVPIELDDGGQQEMVLENLSLGGACLTGAPESWAVGETVSFGLTLREGSLALSGSVRWRLGDSVGLCFEKLSPNHDMLVQMAIRLMLEQAL